MRKSAILNKIFFILAFCLSASAAAAPTILVFGDSLSSGYGLAPGSGWVSLLQERLTRSGFPHEVTNASLTGETTLGGKNRIGAVLKRHRPDIVILELGGNDGLRGLAPETTLQNLETIILACRKSGARVLLVGMRLPPNYGTAYTEKFRDIYPRLAKRHRLPLAPFLLEGVAENLAWFQSDGIHPSARAQTHILDNVWRHLLPLLATQEALRG